MADGDLNTSGGIEAEGLLQLQADNSGSVVVPDGHSLADASFEISGGDLLINWPDGMRASVEGFSETTPTLNDSDGISLSGDMTLQLAQIDAPEVSQSVFTFESGSEVLVGTDGDPIGNVDELSGSVWAVRVDGTRVELNVGDAVFQGDTIESGSDGSIGIILADETTFSMGEDGLMVLDEMIYDPATQEGSVSLSSLEGVFTFVSGAVAKTDPDAMTIDTPVATIGIRGTQVGINLTEDGDMKIVLMEEADGFVGEVVVANDGGVVILNTAFAGTSVGDYGSTPDAIVEIDRATFLQDFGAALKALPASANANNYGLEDANLQLMIEEAVQEIEQAIEEAEEEAAAEVAAEEAAEEEAAAAEEEAEEETEEEVELEVEVELSEEEEEEVVEEVEEEVVEEEVVEPEVEQPPPEIVITQSDDTLTGGGADDNFLNVIPTTPTKVPEPEPEKTRPVEVEVIPTDGEGRVIANVSTGTFIGTGGSFYVKAGTSTSDLNIFLGTGNDKVETGSGDDFIISGDGNDIVDAGAGDDLIVGGLGRGDDTYMGGEGADWAIYPSAQFGYDLLINLGTSSVDLTLGDGSFVHLDAQSAVDASDSVSWIDSDTLISIENIVGGEGSDVIAGSDGDNTLIGNLGDDSLFGGAGDDILIGGSTFDNADDSLSGRDFIGLNPVESGGGSDYLHGGAGFDTVVYAGTFGDYTF